MWRPRLTMAVMATALLATACLQRQYRYVTLPDAPAEALEAMERSAQQQNICPSEPPSSKGRTMAKMRDWEPDKDCPPPRAVARLPTDGSEVSVRAFALPEGGTRIELSGSKAPIHDIFPGAKSSTLITNYVFPDYLMPVFFEPKTRLAVAVSSKAAMEVSQGFQFGYRFYNRGGGRQRWARERSWALFLEAAADGRLRSNDFRETAWSFRMGAGLQYDSLLTARPVAERHLQLGQRRVLRLAVEAATGDVDWVGLSLSAHPFSWFGVFARVGHEFGPDAGPVYTLGLEAGENPSWYVIGIPAATALFYGIGVVLGKLQPNPP